jgi:hypothetical protein
MTTPSCGYAAKFKPLVLGEIQTADDTIGGSVAFGGFNSALAAEVPAEFRGVWIIASGGDNQCRKSDWDDARTDGMMSVSAALINYWESSCEIVEAKKLAESTVSLSLACRGEGTTWRSKEVWYVQRIGRKQLVTVSLGTSDLRDDLGKRVGNPDEHKTRVSINLECK